LSLTLEEIRIRFVAMVYYARIIEPQFDLRHLRSIWKECGRTRAKAKAMPPKISPR